MDLFENAISDIKKARAVYDRKKKKPVIGWFCTYTPIEIFYAAGLTPKRLMSKPTTMNQALGCMQTNLCPYVLNSLEVALQGEDPIDGIVIVNSCDAMRRLYDVWRYYVKTDFVHLLDLPRDISKENHEYFVLQVRNLISALEKYFAVKISLSSLNEAITLCNETRNLLKALYGFRQGDDGYFSGSDVLDMVKLGMRVPAEIFNEGLKKLLGDIRNKSVGRKPESIPKKPRIFVIGSFFDQTQIKIIEECGADVICDQLCIGMSSLDVKIPADTSDPIRALAEGYLSKIPCSRMINPGQKIDSICGMVDKYRIDGVIFLTLKFCDNNIFFFPLLKKELYNRDISVILIESDGTSDNTGQIRTRVETFLGVL